MPAHPRPAGRRHPRPDPSGDSSSRAATRDRRLVGPPLVLPAWLDALSDRWWGLTPRTRTVLVVALVVGAGLASAGRAVLGPTPPVPVLVATRDLPVGHALGPGDLADRRWPADLAPPAVAAVADGTLVAPLPTGSPLTERHLTAAGISGLVDPGTAAVPVPRELVAEVEVGATVSVVAVDVDGRGLTLAEAARVVAVDATSIWVGTPPGVAAEVAAATLRGTIALVLVPP